MTNRLYVGNLSYDSTEDDVRAAFGANGRTVTDVHVPLDKETGRPRGFAFVEMGSKAEAEEAIDEMDGAELQGRNLRVNIAVPKPKHGGHGGGNRHKNQGDDRRDRW